MLGLSCRFSDFQISIEMVFISIRLMSGCISAELWYNLVAGVRGVLSHRSVASDNLDIADGEECEVSLCVVLSRKLYEDLEKDPDVFMELDLGIIQKVMSHGYL